MAITFQRPLSPTIQAILASTGRTFGIEFACIVTFKDNSQAYWATKALSIDSISNDGTSVSITPIPFDSRIAGKPSVKQSQSKQPDISNFSVVNLDYLVTAAMTNAAQPYVNAQLLVYLCFPKSNGNYEGLVYFVGAVRDVSGSDEEAELVPISDMSYRNAYIGFEMTQRCTNELGDGWCQVNNLPGGAVCSKIWHDAVGGCAFWGGVFRGAPFINPNSLLAGSSTGTFTSDNGDIWSHHCVDLESTWYRPMEGPDIHAESLKVGDILRSVRGRPVIVKNIETFHEDRRYVVQTDVGAGLIVSATHLFLRTPMDTKGKAACEWNDEEDDLVVGNGSLVSLAMRKVNGIKAEYSFRIAGPGMVQQITLQGDDKTFWASYKKGVYLASHNKEVNPDTIFGGMV